MSTMKKSRLFYLILIVLLDSARVSAQTTRPDAERKLAHDIYKEFVEVQSSFTTGATTPVAEAAAVRLRAAGFPESDIFVGGAIPKKANLVVRYHGTGALKPVLLLAHIDVVEAKREDWSMDPFQLNERDGFFYGRGTGDDKAQAALWIANLIQYKKEGFKPDRDIIVALTANDEGGWGASAGGKKISNDLQVSEKYVVNFRLEVRNKGGHSSMPVADNAIYRLAAALQRLSNFGFPLKTNEVTAAYFQQMAKIESGPMKEDLAKVGKGLQEAMQRIAAASPAWNATLRTTCVATLLEGGHAMNALPQLATATVNCRVLPEDSVDYVQAVLRKVVADDQVDVKILGEPAPGPASALRPDVLAAVSRATEALWPGVPVVPIMVMGATDGKALRIAGIPTYGVQGIFFDRDDIRFHGRDERVAVQSFYEGQAFLYDLVKTLSKTTPVAQAAAHNGRFYSPQQN